MSRLPSDGIEWNGKERSVAVYPPSIFTGVPPRDDGNGGEWSRNPPSIFTLYASPVESYGRGAWFDLFFSLNPDVREIYSCSVSFLSFLKKIEMLFHLYPIYHRRVICNYATVHHGQMLTLVEMPTLNVSRVVCETCSRRDADVKCIKPESRRGAQKAQSNRYH